MENFQQFTFRDAARLWLASRSKISAQTRRDYENMFRQLNPFFGDLKLDEISIDHLNRYRELRQAAIAKKRRGGERDPTTGSSRINHECSALGQVLKRAHLWSQIADWYEPLPLPKDGPGRALTAEEEDWIFQIAAANPRWRVAYCCAVITNNTTAGPEEIRKLHLEDIVDTGRPLESMIHVREGIKNGYRDRWLELNFDAYWAVRELVKRAREKGSTEPRHYLLPHYGHGHYDPTRPMNTWKRAWDALRKKAAERYPHLRTLRRYDLRHNAITKLLEDPETSERTVIEMAGHVSRKMLARYSHVRHEARAGAVSRLKTTSPNPAQLRLAPSKGKPV